MSRHDKAARVGSAYNIFKRRPDGSSLLLAGTDTLEQAKALMNTSAQVSPAVYYTRDRDGRIAASIGIAPPYDAHPLSA